MLETIYHQWMRLGISLNLLDDELKKVNHFQLVQISSILGI